MLEVRRVVVLLEGTGERLELSDPEIYMESCSPCSRPVVSIKGFLSSESLESIVKQKNHNMGVNKVIFNDPATIVYWKDGTRTVVKCQPGDEFNPEMGFLLAFCKKACGNDGSYNELLKKYVPGYENEKKGHMCRTCKHCDVQNLICRPNSKDCRSIVLLTEEDLDTAEPCDSYEKRESEKTI